MRRSYKFRLRPTARQHVALQTCLDVHRRLYNAALEERLTAWRRHRVSVRYEDQSAQLKEIRAICPEQSRWSFSSQQATLRRLNKAFEGFFRRVKLDQKPGFPRFRSEHRFDSVEWPRDGDGCRFKPEHGQVYLQGLGTLKVSMHRPVEGVVKTVSVKREGRRWFLILSCDNVPTRYLPATGSAIGIDMGITVCLATSNGDLVANPRHGRTAAQRLALAQQFLAKKHRGSTNRRKQRDVVANRHRKVTNQRRDFHHQLSRRLVVDHDVLVIEDLAIRNMCRSAAGTADNPGTRVASKRGLNRSILDASWAAFATILAGKAEEAGRQVIRVRPQHTSQTHWRCGKRGTRNGTIFWCPHCAAYEHADVNAARNILRAGLALPTATAA
jgi:putative transposase